MDLIFFLGGIAIVAIIVVTLGNWRERRAEYRPYLGHPTPPGARPAGNYGQFVRVWRKYHRSYPAYREKTMASLSSRLSLGAYLRHCELKEAAESPSGTTGPVLDSSERSPSGPKPKVPPPTRPART